MQPQHQVNTNELPPYVTFETRAVEDRNIILPTGGYGFRDITIAKITRPGQRDTVEKDAEAWLADLKKSAADGRVPPNWFPHFRAMYDAWKSGEEIPENGTALKGWALATAAEQKTLLALGFRSVEELAAATDEAVQRIGIGGLGMKQKAVNWLKESQEKGASVTRVTALEMENQTLKGTLEKMVADMASLKARLESLEPAKKAA